MAKLIFNAEDVRRVVEHSLAAKDFRQKLIDIKGDDWIYEPGKPGDICLVHDQGVYLMSAGEPGDPLDGKGDGKYFRRYVAYAEGCDPTKDKDTWWETSRELVGGDDFGEHLDWGQAIKDAIDRGMKKVVIHFSQNQIRLAFHAH